MASKTNTDKNVSTESSPASLTLSSPKTWKNADGTSSGSNVTYIRPSQAKPGVLLEGIFTGTIDNKFEPTKKDFRFELEDGSIAIINSAGNLASRLNGVAIGTLVQVSYEGQQTIKKGRFAGKKAHSFNVKVAAD